jgi:hypothetical protein
MRKKAHLSIRVTEQEMASLRELAHRDSVRVSELVRGILAANTKQTVMTNLFRRLTTSPPGPELPRA